MAVSNAVQLGLGTVAAGAVAIAVVVVAPMLRPADGSVPAVVDIVQVTPAEIGSETPTEIVEVDVALVGIAPRLDTFRVEADGNTVFAGRAAPNQVVDILLGGSPIERVTTDASGSFVAFPQLPFSDGSQAISLLADPDGAAIVSAETYLIAPITAPVMVAVVAPEPALQESAAVIDIPVPQPAAAAPAILVVTAEGVEVLQPTLGDVAPDVHSNVALDSITYDSSGEVLIAGRAAGEGFVKVYLDNQPVTTSRIVAGGTWRTDLPDVDTGIYTLRIDEVDVAGEVVSRIETPFKREEREVVAQALSVDVAKPEFQVAMTTVQPGSTLWAIARDRFGDGIMYVEVFEANRDRIRDPNLIYPGQVFRMPEGDQ
ncbi:MAG: nucleoid-associated protein YgaU [Yoonia sp.]|jgi:nucleoid-associated protein YgaU